MIDQRMWKIIQKRLGYNGEELELFRSDPRNELVMSKGAELISTRSLSTPIFAAQELIYAGTDPNEMRFKSAGCIDVGLHCGGWGKIYV